MVDVIQIIGERVQNEWNRHGGTQWTFRKDKSNARVEFLEVRYGAMIPSAGKLVKLDQGTFFNKSPTEKLEDTFSVNKKTTCTFSYSFKESFGVKLSAKVQVPIVGETGVETSLNFESTQTQGTGEEQSWTHSTKISVPPKKQVKASFMVQEVQFNAPIWGRVRVRGRLFLQSPTWTVPHLEPDIEGGLINLLKWWPGTFEYEMEGSFVAARGDSYFVQVDESNLPMPTPSGARAEIEHTQSVIDTGRFRDGSLQSDFEAWKQFAVPQ